MLHLHFCSFPSQDHRTCDLPHTISPKNLLAFCGRTTTAAWQLAPRKQKKEQQKDQSGDFQLAFVVHIALSFACGELQVASPQKAPA